MTTTNDLLQEYLDEKVEMENLIKVSNKKDLAKYKKRLKIIYGVLEGLNYEASQTKLRKELKLENEIMKPIIKAINEIYGE